MFNIILVFLTALSLNPFQLSKAPQAATRETAILVPDANPIVLINSATGHRITASANSNLIANVTGYDDSIWQGIGRDSVGSISLKECGGTCTVEPGTVFLVAKRNGWGDLYGAIMWDPVVYHIEGYGFTAAP